MEKALEIFSLVSGVIKTSTRAGGHVRISSDFNFIVCGDNTKISKKTCYEFDILCFVSVATSLPFHLSPYCLH